MYLKSKTNSFLHSYWVLGGEAFCLHDWQPSQQPLHYRHPGGFVRAATHYTTQKDLCICTCNLIYIRHRLTTLAFPSKPNLWIWKVIIQLANHRCQLHPVSCNLEFYCCIKSWSAGLKFNNCCSVKTPHVDNKAFTANKSLYFQVALRSGQFFSQIGISGKAS